MSDLSWLQLGHRASENIPRAGGGSGGGRLAEPAHQSVDAQDRDAGDQAAREPHHDRDI